ncbi:hypothetical protein FOA52_008991 [Chlamydomonas sp. UWO 241]|nr:hypothetical protein FOA52_008991 [Chlamydomonas sp. UWO 241]
MANSKSSERIYSSAQLVSALRSGLGGVRDQLGVLAILDGTASSWPGVNQALDDMEFLVDMSAGTTSKLEGDIARAEAKYDDCKSEVVTLKDTLANANHTCEQQAAENSAHVAEIRQLASKLDAASKEVGQQRQELWTLEKQRADLASELERYKQDNEFMEAEITTLRSTVNEQLQQLTVIKEDLAARKADVAHLSKQASDFKTQNGQLKKSLDSTSAILRTCQADLEMTRTEKINFEREAERWSTESARLAAELAKLTHDVQRAREWAEVVKKVEGDKLREEQTAHMSSKLEFERGKGELANKIAALQAELEGKEQLAFTKTAEASAAGKQIGLMNIQMRDLNKTLSALQGEARQLGRERDAAKAETAKAGAKAQAAAAALAKVQREHADADAVNKEAAHVEKAKLQAQYEEARKEGAVQKALSDGWARDMREVTRRCKEAEDEVRRMQAAMNRGANGVGEARSEAEAAAQADAAAHIEMVKRMAVQEQVIKEQNEKIAAKDVELRRFRAETQSQSKGLEQQVRTLQRECNESALEIQRLRGLGNERLPAIGGRGGLSLEDDLNHLKRFMVGHGASGGGKTAPAVQHHSRGGSPSPGSPTGGLSDGQRLPAANGRGPGSLTASR